jgi:hypothetical protein
VLCTAILNLIKGGSSEGFPLWLLELGGFLIIVGTIDYFISKINYSHWFILIMAEFVVNYIVFLVGAIFLRWFIFNLEGIFIFTIIFIVVFTAVYYHSYLLIRQDEEYLNKLIKLKHNE